MNYRLKMLIASLTLGSFFFLASCSKSNDDNNPTPPVPASKPDTLSAGWKKILVTPVDIFTDVFFNSPTNGYIAGRKLYRSIDGGLTWNVAAGHTVNNLAVTNDGKVFLVNEIDTIYRSADGGATISGLKTPGAAGFDAFFIDNDKGYYITSSGLYATSDGGMNWARLNTTGLMFSSAYSSVFFTSVNNGIAVTTEGIYRTDGSSVNWKKAITNGGLSYKDFGSVFITPNNTTYVANRAQELYKSTDGGTTFNMIKQFQPGPVSFSDVHFVDNNTGYFSAGNRIYKTTDAGTTWNMVVALGDALLVEIHFTDAAHGWACGSNGTVLVFN